MNGRAPTRENPNVNENLAQAEVENSDEENELFQDDLVIEPEQAKKIEATRRLLDKKVYFFLFEKPIFQSLLTLKSRKSIKRIVGISK